MLGQGLYRAQIDTMFYKGEGDFGFYEENGEYKVKIQVENPPVPIPQIILTDVLEEGDTLTATASTPALPGRTVDIKLTFQNDRCNGYLKVPFIGKVKITDAVKISD